MNKAFVVSLAMQLAVLFIPFLQDIFRVTSLNVTEWIIVIGLSLIPLIVSELNKLIRHGGKNQNNAAEMTA